MEAPSDGRHDEHDYRADPYRCRKCRRDLEDTYQYLRRHDAEVAVEWRHQHQRWFDIYRDRDEEDPDQSP